ncbi:Asparaginase/glutaminase [Piedraia hortae CBS 480.64]|uniref:asparaginase n=1 Tax=Piedraia hortae CBS 480.64 TaxID=1314780 RepID=A0A6A7C0Z2_9PEZI|nr:Asparaginase/glutaminase [Piedraia hortae CBS 480.64]
MEKKILIILTGGTICMKPSHSGYIPSSGFLEEGVSPKTSLNDGTQKIPLPAYPETPANEAITLPSLRTPKSRHGRHVRYCVLEFSTILDSSSINQTTWSLLATTISKNHPLFDGFIILHGTDTLAYTSSALSYLLTNLDKTVILTGSQTPIFELRSDGESNLLDSLMIAGHYTIPEVCLFFNRKLYRGNRCTKVSVNGYEAFASPNFPPLAVCQTDRIEVNWDLVLRNRDPEALRVEKPLEMGGIDILGVFPGMTAQRVGRGLSDEGLRGIVVLTFGAGNVPSSEGNSILGPLKEAAERGVVIVSVTQCLVGSVTPRYAPAAALEKMGVVPGWDLTLEATVTKLAFLFAQGRGQEEVKRLMTVPVRGEMTVKGKL